MSPPSTERPHVVVVGANRLIGERLTDARIERVDVAADTGDLDGIRELVATAHPDVVVLASRLPAQGRERLIMEVRAALGRPGCLVVSGYDTDVEIVRLFAAGALGYVDPTTDTVDVVDAIGEVARDAPVLGRRAAAALLRALADCGHADEGNQWADAVLAPPDVAVLRLIARGIAAEDMERTHPGATATLTSMLDRLRAASIVQRW